MRKFVTLFAALLFSLSLMAGLSAHVGAQGSPIEVREVDRYTVESTQSCQVGQSDREGTQTVTTTYVVYQRFNTNSGRFIGQPSEPMIVDQEVGNCRNTPGPQ